VSAMALSAMIRANSPSLEMSPQEATLSDRELPIRFDRCFESANVRDPAEKIAIQFAQRVGYLLTTLKRGDDVNRAARSDCDHTFWDHWATIQTVHFGGGLLSGNLGRRFIDDLNAFWTSQAFPPMKFSLAPHGDALPLVGAAMTIREDCDKALVFDFGGSYVKRAVAQYEMGTFKKLFPLRSLPAGWTHEEDAKRTGANVRDFMVETICKTWAQVADASLARQIPLSLAAYVRDGQPLERQGGDYSMLCHLSEHADEMLSRAVSLHLHTAIKIELHHDGTAAANVYRGEKNSAILTFGTAIGHGFPS
jgi:hypothetical protein